MLPDTEPMQNPLSMGSEVKALDEDGDRLKVGGYPILFGNPETADLVGDFFTKSTDFGFDLTNRGRVRWQHGMDPKIGREVLGLVEFKTEPDDVGLWAEGWIRLDTPYKKKMGEWVKNKELGWSTGVAPNCVGRKPVGKAFEITEWIIGADVSMTRHPCDPRQLFDLSGGVIPLKTFVELVSESTPDGAAPAPSFVEDCLRLATDLRQSAAEFVKHGKTKREAYKSLRDAWDDLYRKTAPIDPAACEARRRTVDELLAQL